MTMLPSEVRGVGLRADRGSPPQSIANPESEQIELIGPA
jgi:hypothetical protein